MNYSILEGIGPTSIIIESRGQIRNRSCGQVNLDTMLFDQITRKTGNYSHQVKCPRCCAKFAQTLKQLFIGKLTLYLLKMSGILFIFTVSKLNKTKVILFYLVYEIKLKVFHVSSFGQFSDKGGKFIKKQPG